MSENATVQGAIIVAAVCGKVVMEEPGMKRRAISANRAIEIASELLEGAARAAGQRAGVKARRHRREAS